MARLSGADNGLSERVLAALFAGGEQLEERVFLHSSRHQIRHGRLAHRHRAGLVKCNGFEAMRDLQRLAALDQNAVLSGNARADHDRRRRRQTERARARDDQNGDEHRQREGEALSGQQPDRGREQRNGGNNRHKHRRYPVGQARNGRFAALRILDQTDHLRERRVVAHARGAHGELRRAVDAAAGDGIARRLVHRQAFAGEHGFVDAGFARFNNAVHGYAPAGSHENAVVFHQAFHGDLVRAAIGPENGRRIGRERHQRLHRRGGSPLAAGFKVFAKHDQLDDDAGRLPVHVVHRGMIAAEDADERIGAVADGGYGAKRNQRIHIRMQAHKRPYSAHIEVPPGDDDRDQQRDLYERICHRLIVHRDGRGQADHRPHGQIEQGYGKADRDKKPALLGAHGRFARTAVPLGLRPPVLDGRGGKPGPLHGLQDRIGRDALAPNAQPLRGEVDRGALHAREFSHNALHRRAAGGAAHAGNFVFRYACCGNTQRKSPFRRFDEP